MDDWKFMRYENKPVRIAEVAPNQANTTSEPQKKASGEICQNVTFTGTKTETIYSQMKPFGIDGGERWPIGEREVTVTKEKEFCQDIYENNVFDASAELQRTINGYAQKNNYSIVSQRDVVFDPCDRSWFGDALLWIGGLFGSDAREISNKHCGKSPEAAAEPAAIEPAAKEEPGFSLWNTLNRPFEMQRETRKKFREQCEEGNWVGCFNLASLSTKL